MTEIPLATLSSPTHTPLPFCSLYFSMRHADGGATELWGLQCCIVALFGSGWSCSSARGRCCRDRAALRRAEGICFGARRAECSCGGTRGRRCMDRAVLCGAEGAAAACVARTAQKVAPDAPHSCPFNTDLTVN
jgi:hypothetical protein